MMVSKKKVLSLTAGLMLLGAINASNSMALINECRWFCTTWGESINLNCGFASGTFGSGYDGAGNKAIAAQLTAENVDSRHTAGAQTYGVTSSGTPIASCQTKWDYTVNGASALSTTGCQSAHKTVAFLRSAYTTSSWPIP